MYLIVGLGNPGRKYLPTRHNVGFMVVDELLKLLELPAQDKNKLFGSRVWTARYSRQRLILAKPQTFMNLSGTAVVSLLGYFKVPLENLIVIHDDLDLGLGRIKIKFSGGTAGHQGLNSLVEQIGKGDFTRLRVGIGRGERGREKDYVLEKFFPEEKKILSEILGKSAEAVLGIVKSGPRAAMNRYNCQ